MKKAYKYIMAIAVIMIVANCRGIYEDATELASEYKTQIPSVTLADLDAKTEKGETFTLIDVRQADDFAVQNIPGSVNIPRGVLEFQISDSTYWASQYMFPPAKDEEVVVYGADGSIGILSAVALKQIGYKKVFSLKDGFKSVNANPAGKNASPQPSGGCGG